MNRRERKKSLTNALKKLYRAYKKPSNDYFIQAMDLQYKTQIVAIIHKVNKQMYRYKVDSKKWREKVKRCTNE
jgi:hypothetical protein